MDTGSRADGKGEGTASSSRQSKPSKSGHEDLGKQRVVREPVVLSRAAPIAAPKKDDDYDDDFEAYEEDFEEETPKPLPKASSARASPLSRERKQSKPSRQEAQHVQQVRESIELENTQVKREAKQAKKDRPDNEEKPGIPRWSSHARVTIVYFINLSFSAAQEAAVSPPSTVHSSTSSPTRTRRASAGRYGSISAMEGLISSHPKSRKIAKLIGSGVLDLQEVKFTQINILPTTQYELYSRKLKQTNPSIVQVGIPGDDHRRDVEVNTDPIETKDEEVQFCYEDDTMFINVLKAIERRRRGQRSEMSLLDEAKGSHQARQVAQASSLLNERLTEFLQRASSICEALIEESNLRGNSTFDGNSGSGKVELFDPASSWQDFGDDEGKGGNEVLRTRRPAFVRFSKIQPHLMIVTYPPEDHPDDLFPGKVKSN